MTMATGLAMGGHAAGRRAVLDVPPAGLRPDRPRRLPERPAGAHRGRPGRARRRGRDEPPGHVHAAGPAPAAEPRHRLAQGRAGAALAAAHRRWARIIRSRCTTRATPGSGSSPSTPSIIPVGRARSCARARDLLFVGLRADRACGRSRRPTLLEAEGWSIGVINARYARPLDRQLILDQARGKRMVVTFEESVVTGGFGSGVLELDRGGAAGRPGLPRDRRAHRRASRASGSSTTGRSPDLRRVLRLDAAGLAAQVREALETLRADPGPVRGRRRLTAGPSTARGTTGRVSPNVVVVDSRRQSLPACWVDRYPSAKVAVRRLIVDDRRRPGLAASADPTQASPQARYRRLPGDDDDQRPSATRGGGKRISVRLVPCRCIQTIPARARAHVRSCQGQDDIARPSRIRGHERRLECPGDLARRYRRTEDQESRNGGDSASPVLPLQIVSAGPSAFSALQRICCSSRRSSEYTSQATRHGLDVVRKHHVDHAAARVCHRDLERKRCHRGSSRAEQRLDHRRLESIVEAWTGAREVTDAEVGAERDADRRQDLEARTALAGLDPGRGATCGSPTTHREPAKRQCPASNRASVARSPRLILTDPKPTACVDSGLACRPTSVLDRPSAIADITRDSSDGVTWLIVTTRASAHGVSPGEAGCATIGG